MKLPNIFFSTLKDAIFIASYLGTYLLILRGGNGIYMGLEYFFKNFLINRCKGRQIFESGNIF